MDKASSGTGLTSNVVLQKPSRNDSLRAAQVEEAAASRPPMTERTLDFEPLPGSHRPKPKRSGTFDGRMWAGLVGAAQLFRTASRSSTPVLAPASKRTIHFEPYSATTMHPHATPVTIRQELPAEPPAAHLPPSSNSLKTLAPSTNERSRSSGVDKPLPLPPAAPLELPPDDTTPQSLESGTGGWEGYEDIKLPAQKQQRFLRYLRHRVFTLYRRLFGVILVVNVAVFIGIIARQRRPTNPQDLAKIVLGNIFASILMRQDYVVNAFFSVFTSVPQSWPLSIRRVCARVYHIGGFHSGCAISGTLWMIYFTIQATINMTKGFLTPATVALSWIILFLLFAIILFAYPIFRIVSHDRFERTHRFLGWTTILLVWCLLILMTRDYRHYEQTLKAALTTAPTFWLLVIMTGSIILPWLRLRKVPVDAVVLSDHAVRLWFKYTTPQKPGMFVRISASPLTEWHSFATITTPGRTGFSLVVSRAGDWTGHHISNPPKHLWVRGIPCAGVLAIAPLFKRIVLVATGSGIGPCAPCLLEKRIPIRLLWASPNIHNTFGDDFCREMLECDPGAVIYDTRKHGKPDMVKLTYKLVQEFDAEAVCIISNQKLTERVVYGMVSRGIPAFGAIWDS